MTSKKLIALEDVYNEDWKTAISRQQKPIPKGEIVEYIESLTNYYGYWWRVKYNGFYYYVNPNDFKELENE